MITSPFLETRWLVAVIAMCGFMVADAALAEGSAELGGHALQAQSVLFVDLLDTSESLVWTGAGTATATRVSDGSLLGVLTSGGSAGGVSGAVRLEVPDAQVSWDVTVFSGGTPQLGRVSARQWLLDSGGFAQSSAADYSLYALAPGGAPGHDSVYQIQLNGIAGHSYDIRANSTGRVGRASGESGPPASATAAPEHLIYLNPPAISSFTPISAGISQFEKAPASESRPYEFNFTSNSDAIYHLVIDGNADGIFDLTSYDDIVVTGRATTGANTVNWDGHDRFGNPLPLGEYQALLQLNVGECHVLLNDAETAYAGVRAFELDPSLTRTGVPMFWNDSPVQPDAVLMPNAEFSLEASGPFGVHPGELGDAPVANLNAHAWGNFGPTGAGKGDDALMDTWFWNRDDVSSEILFEYTGPAPPPAVPVLGTWGRLTVLALLAIVAMRAVPLRRSP